MEHFPWIRLVGVEVPEVRDLLDDGNFGGYYERSDGEMQEIWEVAVQETRAVLVGPWS